jgi:hypothetical protein
MVTRIFFLVLALVLIGAAVWAYQHDQKLDHSAAMVNLGDPNEAVRELMGEPSSEGECGSLTLAPEGCADEYVYRHYYSIFHPQYEVIWFDHSGKVIGQQHVERPF